MSDRAKKAFGGLKATMNEAVGGMNLTTHYLGDEKHTLRIDPDTARKMRDSNDESFVSSLLVRAILRENDTNARRVETFLKGPRELFSNHPSTRDLGSERCELTIMLDLMGFLHMFWQARSQIKDRTGS